MKLCIVMLGDFRFLSSGVVLFLAAV